MTGDDTGGDDQPPGEAGVDADVGLQPPKQGFQVVSTLPDVNPGDDTTWCYYFRTPNTGDVEIQKWESQLSEGVQGVVLYTTSTEYQPAGTLISKPCGYTTTGFGPVWIYQSQTERDQLTFPADDGTNTGHAIGFPLKAGQYAYLQIHVVNTGTAVIHAPQVKINGNTYASTAGVIDAGPFVTYSSKVQLTPGSPAAPTTGFVAATCTVPANVKFFAMSTHTFRHGTRTLVTDTPSGAGAATTVFEGTDWQKPNDISKIPAGTFYKFTGSLTYRCEYSNTESASIKSGDNAKTDEICVSIGYFFPSPGGTGGYCLDGIIFN